MAFEKLRDFLGALARAGDAIISVVEVVISVVLFFIAPRDARGRETADGWVMRGRLWCLN